MRIQSNFKDYYDVGMKFGQDQTLVYKRYVHKIEIGQFWLPSYTYQSYYDKLKINLSSNIIGFAGNTFCFVKMLFTPKNKTFSSTEERYNTKFLYSLEDLDKQVDKLFPDDLKYEYYNNKYIINNKLSRIKFEKFYKKKDEQHPNFEKYNCPIFYYEIEGLFEPKYYLVTNGPIGQFDMVKILDPYQAYQQLAMYLGNIAEPRKLIPQLDDKTMCEIKGFNKYSFRKDKSK